MLVKPSNLGMIGIILLILVLGVAKVSSFEYDGVMQEHKRYCKMVAEGSWQDFKQIYEEECRGLEAPML